MCRPVHVSFILGTALAISMPYIPTAVAQDVQLLCASIGDDDRLRPIPATLIPKVRQLFGISMETPSAFVRKSTSFRCMKGKVWLCNYGANIHAGKQTRAALQNVLRTFAGKTPAPISFRWRPQATTQSTIGNAREIRRRYRGRSQRSILAALLPEAGKS